jgi:hypothetical protein
MGGILVNILDSLPGIGLVLGNGYRPPEWSYSPQLVSLSANVPSTVSSIVSTTSSAAITSTEGDLLGFGTPNAPVLTQNNTTAFTPVTYFFDAVLRLHHEQRLHATEHPVQNGAAISDHAFILPSRVTLEVQFSDAMDSYLSGQYTGYRSKSVSAYQTFLNLRNLRIPLILTTRLDTYFNMLLEEIISDEDERTTYSWKGRLTLKQIFTATVQTQTPNGRPNQLTQTAPGASTPQPVPQNIENNYLDPTTGDWSSNPLESQS